MSRPRLPANQKHEHEFRLRLQETDAMLIRAISKKIGITPAELVRVLVKSRLEALPVGLNERIKKSTFI